MLSVHNNSGDEETPFKLLLSPSPETLKKIGLVKRGLKEGRPSSRPSDGEDLSDEKVCN